MFDKVKNKSNFRIKVKIGNNEFIGSSSGSDTFQDILDMYQDFLSVVCNKTIFSKKEKDEVNNNRESGQN